MEATGRLRLNSREILVTHGYLPKWRWVTRPRRGGTLDSDLFCGRNPKHLKSEVSLRPRKILHHTTLTMKNLPILLLAFSLLPLSGATLHAQVGAAASRAAVRAAAVSAMEALEREQVKSSQYPYRDNLPKGIPPDFSSPKFDMEFWFGDPIVVASPVLPDGGFDISAVLKLYNCNYNTWRVTIGPYIDPKEYENHRQESGKSRLTKLDSLQVFYKATTDRASFPGFQEKLKQLNEPKPKRFPSSFSDLSASGWRWLCFSLFLYWLISTIGVWNIFYKAECRPKGYAFIPFWRITGLCRVARFRPAAALWMLVPVVNIVFWVVLHVRLCKNFGVPGWLGFLALVFPPALWWLIGRSSDVWYQPK